MGGDNEGKRGKGCQGTCVKDPWTESKGGRMEMGSGVGCGGEEVVGGKWRQLYLNINQKQ